MKALLQICVAMTFAGSAMSQTKPKDVDGWGKVKWGMTIRQAKAALGSQARESDDKPDPSAQYVGRLIVDGLKIGTTEMTASVFTPLGSEAIKAVSLEGTAEFLSISFKEVRTLLTQKYGKPTHEESENDGITEDLTVVWAFPSTVIRLEWMRWKSTRSENLTVVYSATNKKALDVL